MKHVFWLPPIIELSLISPLLTLFFSGLCLGRRWALCILFWASSLSVLSLKLARLVGYGFFFFFLYCFVFLVVFFSILLQVGLICFTIFCLGQACGLCVFDLFLFYSPSLSLSLSFACGKVGMIPGVGGSLLLSQCR